MTSRDFKFIADTLYGLKRDTDPATFDRIVGRFSYNLKAENPRFKAEWFMRAAYGMDLEA